MRSPAAFYFFDHNLLIGFRRDCVTQPCLYRVPFESLRYFFFPPTTLAYRRSEIVTFNKVALK